jgi:N-dimethylarginine dimethylaminohydrolase
MSWSFPDNETGRLTRVVVKHARDAFIDQHALDDAWRALNYAAAPSFERAVDESDAFVALLESSGAEVLRLPQAPGVGPDSIYVRDASIVTPHGLVLCGMGKPLRAGEPEAQRAAFDAWQLPVAGAIEAPGTLEGGDLVWLDARTVAVGRGYRTNDEGIRQLAALLGDAVDELQVVALPHWRGPADVFHLMSIISPIDHDLALVYSPLMPVPFREWLASRNVALVEVPDEEFERMAGNVLALAPRRCLMLDGCPATRARLERERVEVLVSRGEQISRTCGGGPTCLTRPIGRR